MNMCTKFVYNGTNDIISFGCIYLNDLVGEELSNLFANLTQRVEDAVPVQFRLFAILLAGSFVIWKVCSPPKIAIIYTDNQLAILVTKFLTISTKHIENNVSQNIYINL